MKKISAQILAKTAKLVAKSSVNSACMFFAYQPKMPKALDKLRSK